MYHEALILIKNMCLMMANKVLAQLGMISPNRPINATFNQEIQQGQQYDQDESREILRSNIPKMNDQQKMQYYASC